MSESLIFYYDRKWIGEMGKCLEGGWGVRYEVWGIWMVGRWRCLCKVLVREVWNLEVFRIEIWDGGIELEVFEMIFVIVGNDEIV